MNCIMDAMSLHLDTHNSILRARAMKRTTGTCIFGAIYLLAACGKVVMPAADLEDVDAHQEDAETASDSNENSTQQWTNPAELANIRVNGEYSPNVSADGLTLYFSSNLENGAYLELFAAVRAAPGLPFQPPQRIDELDDAEMHDSDPQISPDGLEIIFVRFPNGGQDELYRSTRPTPAAVWSTPVWLGFGGRSPSFSGDGLSLYYVTNQGMVRKVTRGTLQDGWSVPQDVALEGAPTQYFSIDVAEDELSILLSWRCDGGATCAEQPLLMEGTRASVDDPFSSFIALPIEPPFPLGGSSLSHAEYANNDTEIYFSGQSATTKRLYVAALVQ